METATAASIVFFTSSIALGVCFWALYCNDKTGRQRQAILDVMKKTIGTELFEPLVEEYDRVSYDAHLWALVLFRNPYDMYGPLIKEAMK